MSEDWQSIGRDLTALAREGRLDPVVGRDQEIDLVMQILCRRTKSNPLLIGESGVGKSAIGEGLAQSLVSAGAPHILRGRRLFEVQLGNLVAGTQFRGDLELRVKVLVRAAEEARMILFIDEIHLLVQAGRGSGMDTANLLKPVLSRGSVSCLGATTPDEVEEMFKVDPALRRRFQTVTVNEPNEATVRRILYALKPRLEEHHTLEITDEAVEAAVSLSIAHPEQGRCNPDRALDLLEAACAAEQLNVAKLLWAEKKITEVEETAKWEHELARATESLDLESHVRASLSLHRLGQTIIGPQAPRHRVGTESVWKQLKQLNDTSH